MSMQDNDSFIREVNEELRSDQMKAVWKRFGAAIITVAVLIVIGVGGSQVWFWWQDKQSTAAGDRFLSALKDARDGKTAEAEKALGDLSKDSFGSYPELARMRLATLLAEKGDAAAAISAFSEIGKDEKFPEALRNVAKLRAAYLLIDSGTYEQVAAEVEQLSVPASASRHSAREALGLAAYKAGDYAKARDWFQLIAEDKEAPMQLSIRANMMLDLIAASGKAS